MNKSSDLNLIKKKQKNTKNTKNTKNFIKDNEIILINEENNYNFNKEIEINKKYINNENIDNDNLYNENNTEKINIENENIDNHENKENNKNEKIIILEKTTISYNKKVELIKKINKIKKKKYLLNIFKIITSYSNEYTENTNGIFIFFHNLPDEVYEKIDNYLNIIYKLHIKTDIQNIFNSELSDTMITETTNNYNIEIDNLNKNLSNKEKMIMRRKKYEEYLQKNQNII